MHHTIEDIICYSQPLMSYYIWFYLPRGHLSGLGSQCNYPALSYKRAGQASILDYLNFMNVQLILEQRTHTQQYNSLLWT
jgi:hypothetical protein